MSVIPRNNEACTNACIRICRLYDITDALRLLYHKINGFTNRRYILVLCRKGYTQGNYASKTLKMTFNKKDYKNVFAYKFVEENVKASVKAVK